MDKIDKEQYERDLRRKQSQHLQEVKKSQETPFQPCMHDQCTECHGTGVTSRGTHCVHYISCTCPKCSRYSL